MSTYRGGYPADSYFRSFQVTPMHYHGRILVPSSSNQTSLGCLPISITVNDTEIFFCINDIPLLDLRVAAVQKHDPT